MSPILRAFVLALVLVALGCSHAGPVAPTPTPAPAPVTHVIPSPMPPAADVPPDTDRIGLPANWHLLDEQTDHIAGVSSERAMKELLAGRQPKRTVIVAVIDGGVDTANTDLRANLWDKRGWNFIGGRDGKNVDHDTYEFTRVYAGCRKTAPSGVFTSLPPARAALCVRAQSEYDKQLAEMNSALPGITQADQVLTMVQSTLKTALKTDSLTDSMVAKLAPTTPDVSRAKQMYLSLASQGITRAEIERAKREVSNRLKYGLDLEFNSRAIVGDDTMNVAERNYGNADVTGPDASHGTHVAGIIGAVRGNGIGVDGIVPGVKIMVVRAVPDGDERDKDVANAIRYAVDNGANVINMSFGKGFSPAKGAVDAAVKYADAHGVLMVHAAGNDGANNDSSVSFPNPRYLDGGRPSNWIEVGASSWKGGANLAAEFSNYGSKEVDLFAPGVDILSTIPGGKLERDSGTSMASPVVAGVAALVMAYYPELSGSDIKKILVNSATRHPTQMVARPGSDKGEMVPFGTLSVSGGIVNAFAAIKMAEQMVHRQ